MRVQTKAIELHHSENLAEPWAKLLKRQVVVPLPRLYFTVYHIARVTIEIHV